MGAIDSPRESAVRRIWEGIIATLVGGLILWFVTSSISQPARTTERMEIAVAPAVRPSPMTKGASLATSPASEAPAPRMGVELPPLASISASIAPAVEPAPAPALDGPSLAAPATRDAAAPRAGVSVSPPASSTKSMPAAIRTAAKPDTAWIALSTAGEAPAPRTAANDLPRASLQGPMVAAPPPKPNLFPYSIPIGSILLAENFAHFKDGSTTDWGPNTSIRLGLDHRNWLVSNVNGIHPVGRRIRLPKEFSFECRYAAYTPEVTRGIVGWWKEPVSTAISFPNDQGGKYSIEWVVKCGNDVTRLNPLGSPSLYARKYYHTIKLPDGSANEIGVVQPTGVLRIDRDNNAVKVFVDGQATVVGTMSPMGQLVGFEIEVVNTKNGALSFTDFKIAR
jgi:hypothetical protein